MRDRVDRMLPNQARDQVLIARIADDELRPFGRGPCEAGGEVVENDDRLASVEKAKSHVAADIAGASRDQNAHANPRLTWPTPINQEKLHGTAQPELIVGYQEICGFASLPSRTEEPNIHGQAHP